MSKKISLPSFILKDLYLHKEWSTYKIAKKFNCNPTVIQNRLKEYKVKLRNPKQKVAISKEKLYDLYIIKKFSTQKISKLLGVGSCTIYYKLKTLNIPLRKKNIICVSKGKLEELYLKKNLSCSEIAKKFNCDPVTISNKLKKFKIKTKNLSLANTLYPKKKFAGRNELKAYMIGFRLGDLNVKAIDKDSTVMVKSSTTKKEQYNLIKEVFGGYGHFKVSYKPGFYSIWCNLDSSFSFLVPKEDKIENWILEDNKYFFAFLAGYADAEANIGVSQGRARFRIRSYDKNILFQAYNKLNILGINTKFYIASKKGFHHKRKYNQDCWGIFVNSKESLLKLFGLLKPYIKHKKRFNDLISAEKNILQRNKKHKVESNDMVNKKIFYVTTPIYYTNADVHLGGAYTTIAADVLARWNRLQGKEVFFLTGTDEHGQKVQETAEKEGLKPKEFVDKIVKNYKEAFKMLNISNDNFIRTTDKEHEEEVKKVLQYLYDKKFIYKGFYESYYCVGCEQYLTQSDLVDGKCSLHNREPELRKEEAYLFKLSSFQKQLHDLIKSGKYEILPEIRRKEILTFIESGLQDISISRLKEKVSWGIELPFDKKHTCFVWVDAFWNYITGLQEKRVFDKFWPADVQLMAKDIIRVHATIWPALLLATKNKLPKTLFVHGYFTVNGQKMSKSLGNVLSPIDLVNKYGPDSVRYFLMRNISFGQDGDISEKALIARHNNELANKLGNLVRRATGLIEDKVDIDVDASNIVREVIESIERFEFDKALSSIFAFVDILNQFVQEKKIWETRDKKDLYELVTGIRVVTVLLWPFIPNTSEKIAKIFNFNISLEDLKKPLKGIKIKKAEVLFKKIDVDLKKESELKTKNKHLHTSRANKPSFSKEKLNKSEIPGIITMANVQFNEWQKLDLRVGKILKAEDIEEADKLYKLTIDIGKEKRVVCAGLKQYYTKEQLKGKNCVLFINLESRTIKGIESKGMILAAVSDNHKKVTLIQPDKDIELGSRVS